MGDQSDQQQKSVERGVALEPPELTRRLFQRSTGNVGVVDVRQPQELYARTAGWGAEHSPLAGRLAARYAIEAQTPVSTRELVMGRSSMEQQFGDFTSAASHSRGIASSYQAATPVASPMGDSVSSPSAQGKLRISRRPPQLARKNDSSAPIVGLFEEPSKPAEVPQSGMVPVSGAGKALVAAARIDSGDGIQVQPQASKASSESVASHVRDAHATQVLTRLLLRKASTAEPDGQRQNGAAAPVRNHVHQAATTDDSPAQLRRTRVSLEKTAIQPPSSHKASELILRTTSDALTPENQAATMLVQPHGVIPIGDLHTQVNKSSQSVLESPPSSHKASKLILRKASDVLTPENQAAPMLAQPYDMIPIGDSPPQRKGISQSVLESPLPLALSQAPSPQIQRATEKDGSSKQEAPKVSVPSGSQGPVVVKETTDHLPLVSGPNIIWRKRESTPKDSMPDVIGSSASTVVARQADTPAVQPNSSAGGQQAPSVFSPEQPQARGNNPDDTTGQIIRTLHRHLAVERERRGIE